MHGVISGCTDNRYVWNAMAHRMHSMCSIAALHVYRKAESQHDSRTAAPSLRVVAVHIGGATIGELGPPSTRNPATQHSTKVLLTTAQADKLLHPPLTTSAASSPPRHHRHHVVQDHQAEHCVAAPAQCLRPCRRAPCLQDRHHGCRFVARRGRAEGTHRPEHGSHDGIACMMGGMDD
jgi:hypothetical protein